VKVSPDGASTEWARAYRTKGGSAQSVVALSEGYLLAGDTQGGAGARLLRLDAPADSNASRQIDSIQLPTEVISS
jgi:hypothetical protein